MKFINHIMSRAVTYAHHYANAQQSDMWFSDGDSALEHHIIRHYQSAAYHFSELLSQK